ncbi:MAG: NAD(P)-binding domain-containing protein [Actinomycetia bacterium]|nr:NAD(P)-binding domain-containing protein [Actinomycetes bacterium]
MDGHEQVVLASEAASGLRAIIAIHSSALGPALGGTRFHEYPDDGAALDDVLRLSRAMSYKNALAGLPLGGGKAVILGDPATVKSEALLEAYGRAVERLGGRYYTACDVGTYVADMDVVGRTTRYVTGRSEAEGGSGDSSLLTALGVLCGIRACAQHLWGSDDLAGRRVALSGVGKVGRRLVDHLRDAGASVVIYDVSTEAIAAVIASHPEIEVASSEAELVARGDVDVYSPNALGGALSDASVASLTATVVCGGANNQLAHPGIEQRLADQGITYAPDYLVNAGGVIQVADELNGFNLERASSRALGIYQTTLDVLRLATDEGIPPAQAADRLAEAIITAGPATPG